MGEIRKENLHESLIEELEDSITEEQVRDIAHEILYYDPENTSYVTENSKKTVETTRGYMDNIFIEGQTKVINSNYQEVDPNKEDAKLYSLGQDGIRIITHTGRLTSKENARLGTVTAAVGEPFEIVEANDTIICTDRIVDSFYFLFDKNVYQSKTIEVDPNTGNIKTSSAWSSFIYKRASKNLYTLVLFRRIDGGVMTMDDYDEINPIIVKNYDEKIFYQTLYSSPTGEYRDRIEKRGLNYQYSQALKLITLTSDMVVGTNTLKYDDYTVFNVYLFKDESLTIDSKYIWTAHDDFYCDKFKPYAKADDAADKEGIRLSSISTNSRYIAVINFPKTLGTTTAEFKAWIDANPVNLLVPLQIRKAFDIANMEAQTYDGQTTIELQTGDIIPLDMQFEVTNSFDNEMKVLKSKLSSLDKNVSELFQSGVNAKQQLVDALTAKGLDVSTSMNWEELINGVSGMSSGMQFVEGTLSIPGMGGTYSEYKGKKYSVDVQLDIDFEPTAIFINAFSYTCHFDYYNGGLKGITQMVTNLTTPHSIGWGDYANIKLNGKIVTIELGSNDSSYGIVTDDENTNLTYYAFGK